MIEKLKELASIINATRKEVKTEEATKTSFILPFIASLGYNIHNPLELIPEYIADFGIKKGEKVDYCIKSDGKPIIIVEAKHHTENLDRHGSQLSRYYTQTKSKFGILTNGIEYRFFADFERSNVMDEEPFFTFNIQSFDEKDVEMLKNFRKNSFDIFAVSSIAEQMKYSSQIKNRIKDLLHKPDDDFIRYLLTDIHKGKKTQQLVDKLRPIVEESLKFVVDEIMTERFSEAIKNNKSSEEQQVEIEEPKDAVNNDENNSAKPQSESEKVIINQINTTKEELEAFFNVKYILRNIIPWNKLHYRDAKNYFSILYDNKNYKWICRLRVEKANKYIILPDGTPSGKSYPLDGLNGIFAYADELIESAKRFVEEQ